MGNCSESVLTPLLYNKVSASPPRKADTLSVSAAPFMRTCIITVLSIEQSIDVQPAKVSAARASVSNFFITSLRR